MVEEDVRESVEAGVVAAWTSDETAGVPVLSPRETTGATVGSPGETAVVAAFRRGEGVAGAGVLATNGVIAVTTGFGGRVGPS